MASTGTITLYIESVDYNGGGAYTRGAQYSNLNARWNVSDSGYLTLSEESYSTNSQYWWICSSNATSLNYRVEWEVQFKPDGGSWQNLYTAQVAVLGPCANYTYLTGTNVKNMMETFCNNFPGVQLTQNGELRVVCGANLAPAPSVDYPYAFPNDVYSEASQVPVHIDVSWTATLNYNANGGTGAPSAQTHSQTGDSYTFTVSNTVPTRTDYRFDGWSTSSSATTPSYHGGDSFTISKGTPTRTLYAVWTEYYRPGSTLDTNWLSHNRSGGNARVYGGSSWIEMRTIDAPTGKGDTPSFYHDSAWYNQRKIGKES